MDEEPTETARPTGRILVVDDEKNAREALVELLGDEGYEVEEAPDGKAALDRLGSFDPELILTDLKMPVMDGLTLLELGRKRSPHASFVVMTAFGSIDTAVRAMREGAENYLTKPLDTDALFAVAERAVERAQLSAEAARLRQRLNEKFSFEHILGDHPAMQRLFKLVTQVSRSRSTALVQGETGTGKELIAAAIHHASPRAEQPFVRLNCASLAESLLESELFGHEKGSFTGAHSRREGRFKQADGGTLFLDEVSEIPMPMQVKLLRFLQEREFERVGGNETIKVDVRLVAATNRDLRRMIDEGTFREDLYYRLNVIQMEIPPLRARRSDIPLLAQHFIDQYSKENSSPQTQLGPDALRALMRYSWPGNVRELENAMERAVVLADGEMIGMEHLTGLPQSVEVARLDVLIPGVTLAELERMAIEQALDAANGSTADAARTLGISQRKIQYRLKEWEDGQPQLTAADSGPE